MRYAAWLPAFIPVIADADTGYGDLHNVQRTVEAFEAAGASGILPGGPVDAKHCGHFADKRVIPSEEMVLKIKAGREGQERSGFRHFRPDHARLVRRVEEHRSRGQAGCAGDEFCRGEAVAGRGGVLKAPGKALKAFLGREGRAGEHRKAIRERSDVIR